MDAAVERAHMIEYQIKERGIRDPAVLAAMLEVPRHLFVADRYQEFAYEDTPLPLPDGQTISQPYIVARMIELLQLKPAERVLEIGAGSGYAAAVLSRIVSEVYTVERLANLADYARERLAELGYTNVHVLCGDGTLGWPEHAPYDGIMVAAGGPVVPESLRQQLAVGGRLVIPIGSHPRIQRLIRLTRVTENDYRQEKLDRVRFVPLIGQEGWESET